MEKAAVKPQHVYKKRINVKIIKVRNENKMSKATLLSESKTKYKCCTHWGEKLIG